jgi:hypothetical protein
VNEPWTGVFLVPGARNLLYRGDNLHIEECLKADLDKARAEYQAARVEFQSLVKDLPTGIPQPDGELRVRQTAAASRAALQRYRDALMRFTEYCLSGTVPKDL